MRITTLPALALTLVLTAWAPSVTAGEPEPGTCRLEDGKTILTVLQSEQAPWTLTVTRAHTTAG